jgi:hypothetical protein
MKDTIGLALSGGGYRSAIFDCGNPQVPDIVCVKLKSSSRFNQVAAKKKYNQPGLPRSLFGCGQFPFDPQSSTAKLDYSFAEQWNVTELGVFVVKQKAKTLQQFAAKADRQMSR